MMTSDEIRKNFLDFFHSRKHEIVPSAPIVIKNDPTLMFTNAGMNQFKDYFLGNKKAKFSRVADTQKCLRVSGKHNDLEEVGVDTYHHTMFEMLGNWSFGDPARAAEGYFKKEAIAWSWELLTEIYKISKDRLYVTVFEGDEKDNLPADDEAMQEWKKWIAADRILLGNKKDNFWEMGDTGPCGPCTEIHVDCRTDNERASIDGKQLVNNDHPQVIEIWNNVFIQYNRLKDGSLEALPAKHVDTGMGLERLVRVLQQKNSNYDTDIFSGTIEATEEISGKEYKSGNDKTSVAFRVIADHIRAIAFTIADGQLPSNTGAGYVIRRILRRAARYYYSYLDYKQPLLHQLIPVLSTQFENVFPELKKQEAFVSKVIREEEESFLHTLDKGLKRIDDIIKASSEKSISGKSAFELYDTYGFPVDLTRLIAHENNLHIDEAGFETEMQQQKKRSRAATAIDTEDWIIVNKVAGNTKFVGYDQLQTESKIIKYRKVKAKGKESFQVVLDQTPFYAESGGQVGDTGELIIDHGKIQVTDTKKENNLIIHFTDKIPEDASLTVTARVNKIKRKSTELHHSATHLLHAALRNVLGTHVAQKGSLVNAEYLRFDFSHFSKTTEEEISLIEKLVNEKIRENIPVVIKELPKEEALQLGAMALFGEKYGDMVRVVIMDKNYSIELCGGTHVGATGELGYFKITHETAVAAGVRRIEAVTGKMAEEFINHELDVLQDVKSSFKNPKDLQKSIENLMDENTSLKKKLELLENKQLEILSKELLQKATSVNGVHFIGEMVQVSSVDGLRKLCFNFRDHFDNYVAVLCANIEGKAAVAIGVSEKIMASKELDAAKIIKEIVSPLIKGGGGGQKTLATAGGQDVSNFEKVIEKIKSLSTE
jgi:alanyl-tRNA synthetase